MEVMFDSSSVGSAISSAAASLQSRDAVIKYFQDKYPAERTLKNGSTRYEWKEKLTDALQALNPNAKRASIARRFQNDTKTGKARYLSTKPSKAHQKEYKELSDMLAKEYHIHGTLCVRYSPGTCESRKIDMVLTGSNAKQLAEKPSLEGIFNVYQNGSYATQGRAGGQPCETEDRENPKRPGKIIKGCTPSLFVIASWS